MSRKKILIIDDEPDIREIVEASLLTLGGWEVLTAPSGEEGLAKARASQPDAILLDVMMPGMDGPTTYKMLRSSPVTSQIPIVLLTSEVQSADQRHFATLGVAGVVNKPFDPLTLHFDVAQALGWGRQGPNVAVVGPSPAQFAI